MADALFGNWSTTWSRKPVLGILVLLLATFLGCFAGAGIVFIGASNEQMDSDAYVLWGGLGAITCGFTAAATSIAPSMALGTKRQSSELPFGRVLVVVLFMFLTLFIALFYLRQSGVFDTDPNVPKYAPLGLSFLTLLLMAPLAASMAVLWPVFNSVQFTKEAVTDEDLLWLRAANRARIGLLNLNGVALGLAMLTTAALYRVYGQNALEHEFVWLTGAGFTFWLAVLYIPVHLTTQRLVMEFVDSVLPISLRAGDASELDSVFSRRKAIREEIGFSGDAKQTIVGALAIASPLLTSILASALKVTEGA